MNTETTAAEAKTKKKEKAPKVEKPIVVSGKKNEDGTIAVNKADVAKFKKEVAEKFGVLPFHHILKLGKKGIVFVWDTRAVVRQIDLSTATEEDFVKSVRDKGESLVITSESEDVSALLS